MKIIDSILINEWDYEKNDKLGLNPSVLSSKSNKKVWWKCEKGHSWRVSPSNRMERNKVSSCPVCSNRKVVQGFNDITTTHPDIAKHWDYSKNAIDITNVGSGSNKYAFWICDKGHSFKSRIYNVCNSQKGMNCPVCRNFEVVEGINDLFTINPELKSEWDYDKNGVNPATLHCSIQRKKFWWKCEKGHSYQTTPYLKAVKHTGCPYCTNQKLMVGLNDLKTLFPEIEAIWDYSKNKKRPEEILGKTVLEKAYFVCEKGHSFQMAIGHLTSRKSCPICSGKQVLVGYNDLFTTSPELAKEWNYNKNGSLTPEQVTAGSEKKVWWKCKKGHEWNAVICSRASGRGCPTCSKERQVSLPEKAIFFYVKKYFNDAVENVKLHNFERRELDIYIPSIKCAIEYDGKNWHNNVESDKRKDELCLKNGIFLIRIRERGCPKYNSQVPLIDSPDIHGNIALLQPSLIEVFEVINSKFNMNINPVIDVEGDLSSINNSLITYEKENSLLANNPLVSLEWNYEKNYPLSPSMVSISSEKKVWWKCKYGHEWMAIVSSRTRSNNNGCPICSNRKVLKGFNDLETKCPDIAKEFDLDKNSPLTPSDVMFSSHKKYWWKCEKGHSFKTLAYLRVKDGVGCPVCAGQKADIGINDLQTIIPNITNFWDYDKNEKLPSEYLPKSEKVVWWKCKNGHSYQQPIFLKIKNLDSCPYCGNRKLLKGFNDLQTRYPELAAEWNYEKNNINPDEVVGSSGSHKRFWWKCKNGHEWETALSSRIGLKTNCPICQIESRRKK